MFFNAEWLHKRYKEEILENLEKEIIAERLKKFYQELKANQDKDYSRSAHLCIRAAINRHLTSEQVGKTFSIITDPVFKVANISLSAKLKRIKEKGKCKVQHHSSIQPEDIKKCYDSGIFDESTPTSLLRVNWFNISLFFCRRGRENQRNLKKTSFVMQKDANNNEYIEMTEEEKTKNHPGGLGDKADEGDPKMFSNGGKHCPVQYFKKLLTVLNPGEEALFQRPKRNFVSTDKVWFEKSPLGVNTLGSMMKEISTAANLSQIYTNHSVSNHSVRSTSITLLDRAGIPVHRIMQVSGHRSETSVKVYCERQTLEQQKQCSEILAAPTSTALVEKPLSELSQQDAVQTKTSSDTYQNTTCTNNLQNSPKFVDFGNAKFQNCNFAFNYKS